MSKKNIGLIILILAIVGAIVAFGGKKFNQPNNQQATNSNPCASSGPGKVVLSASGKNGNYLVDKQCMTLYTNSKDSFKVSACYDACTKTWPPFITTSELDLKTLTVDPDLRINMFQRTDQSLQLATGRQPLYYYAGDKKPGDTNGNGLDGIWSIVPIQPL